MKNRKPENPFPITTYLGSEYFCNREEETAKLIGNMQNGSSTTLIAVRRMGKTGLLHHTLSHLPNGWLGIYTDILESENLNQFLSLLATSVINANPGKRNLGKKLGEFIKSLRPQISFDTLTGIPQVSFDIRPNEIPTNIGHVFQYLEKQDFKTIVAIDEFQQILNYPEKNTEAWLRSRIQQLKNVVFIFSGSQQHLMTEIFNSPKRPFFRSTLMIKLEKLDKTEYVEFIVSLFRRYGKEIDPATAEEILEWSNNHTYYVQQVCNRVFAATPEKAKAKNWQMQAYMLLKEQETVFFNYRNMLTNSQWRLLKAIAHEEVVHQPTSKEFLNKFQLGTSATVLRSLKTLLGYELVYFDFDPEGMKYYSVYDVFFQRWIQKT
ncbi:MAG TPA: ATP-binding protein [Cyclobacteriaceae bacterium]|nr:ATP-binding protein [Cyclobacteriaceae bacterium]